MVIKKEFCEGAASECSTVNLCRKKPGTVFDRGAVPGKEIKISVCFYL